MTISAFIIKAFLSSSLAISIVTAVPKTDTPIFYWLMLVLASAIIRCHCSFSAFFNK